jgi:hypothetical protein
MQQRRRAMSWKIALLPICSLLGPVVLAGGERAGASVAMTFQGSGSINEAWLTGARAGDRVALLHNSVAVLNPGNPGTADCWAH